MAVQVFTDINDSHRATGYPEPTHFGRFFRRRLGLSPLAWRRQQVLNSPGN